MHTDAQKYELINITFDIIEKNFVLFFQTKFQLINLIDRMTYFIRLVIIVSIISKTQVSQARRRPVEFRHRFNVLKYFEQRMLF